MRHTNPMLLMKNFLPTGFPSGFQSRCARFCVSFGAVALLVLSARTTRANVYATNIRLNGSFANVHQLTATNVEITYVLNEPATLGLNIDIKIGTNVVRTISLTNPSPGTLLGSNVVVWDGTDNNGTSVGSGAYQVSI